jgi:hypothetical protein
MSKHDLEALVVDEVVDPGTRRVLLKFDDGTFEATPWPATRFRLPGYIGLIRAQVAPLLEKPGEPFYDVTRWFLVTGIIIAAVPLIATLIADLWPQADGPRSRRCRP